MDEITLDELIEKLIEIRDGEQAGYHPVRVAWQPHYPLYGGVNAVFADLDTDEPAIYLAGGVESAGYLSEHVASSLRNEGWQ